MRDIDNTFRNNGLRLSGGVAIGILLFFGFLLASPAEAVLYYVNDSVTNGDVYCTTTGSVANSGLLPSSPKATLQQILDTYVLSGGDVVYVDTGVYSNETTTISSAHSGSPGSYILIQGSTNYAAGGTVFDRNNSSAYVITLAAGYAQLRDMTLRGGARGVSLYGVLNPIFERIRFANNTIGYFGSGGGNHNGTLSRCLFANNSTAISLSLDVRGYALSHCVFWNNGIAFNGGSSVAPGNTMSHCVVAGSQLVASGGALPAGDYNVVSPEHAVQVGAASTVSEWQSLTGGHLFSMAAHPSFADPASMDFHPRSEGGRYNPVTGLWVTDSVTCILVDYGDPSSTLYTNEPAPNGGRLNAGLFGGSSEASKTPTNAWLRALSYNDGGVISGTGRLAWTAGSITNTATVSLDYSTNSGAAWTIITNGLPVTNRFFTWVVTNLPPSAGFWRIRGEAGFAGLSDTNDARFSLNGGVIPFFLNDLRTNDDVYCTAAGSDTNSGIDSSSPMLTLTNLLARYRMRPLCVVYVDNGNYSNYTVTISDRHAGTPVGPVTVQGSTNSVAGRSVFARNNSGQDCFQLLGSPYVTLSDLTVRNGRRGVSLNNTANAVIQGVIAAGNQAGFHSDGQSLANAYIRCVAANNSQYGFSCDKVSSSWDQGVSWNNAEAFRIGNSSYLSVSNSVIAGGTAFSVTIPASGDYNIFWNTALGGGYPSLNEFQKARVGWWNSAYLDPLFANPANLDFHPRSVVGAFSNGVWITYSDHSPCIDLGDPLRSFNAEPQPHGSNVNIGIFGNTSEASKSRTNAWLQVLNYNDGGVLTAGTGTTDSVLWRASGYPAGATVRIELSLDRGSNGTWQTVATGILASAGSYTWVSTNIDASSYFARWRVVYDADTNNFSATTYTNFTFRSGPFKYYVNDSSTNGDVYCTAPGNNGNLGTSAGSPKRTLKSLLDDHDVEPGDIVYIDTGFYDVFPADLPVIGSLDSGNTNANIYILGSTNFGAGGTIVARSGISFASGAQYVEIRDIAFSNSTYGLLFNNASNIWVSNVQVYGGGTAFDVQGGSQGIHMDYCVGASGTRGLRVSGSRAFFSKGVLWNNSESGVRAESGFVAISNSVVGASNARSYGYYSATMTNILGDYNCFHMQNDAPMGYIANLNQEIDTHSAWVNLTAREKMSFQDNPFFGGGTNTLDFHEMTEEVQGRWVAGSGWLPGVDPVTSPLIDAGDPLWPFTNEVPYNGGRINIGLYGNTPEASRRRTNAWIYAASLRVGGWVRGTSTLHWVVGGAATGHNVKIEYSPNGGETWSVLTNGIAASLELFTWNTTTTNNTPAGLWRVTSLTDPSLTDQTTNFFAVRNAPLSFFVNDANTAFDVYTTAPGSFTNWVATSNRPLDSLARALTVYDFEPGDAIYIDTGFYTNNENIVWGKRHSGHPTNYINIIGSTNDVDGRRTVFDRARTNAGSVAIHFQNVQGIALSNVVVRGANIGLRLSGGGEISFGRVRAIGNSSNGFDVASCTNVVFSRVVSAENQSYGIQSVSNWLSVVSSVIWSNQRGALLNSYGSAGVSNTVLHAYGLGRYIFTLGFGGRVSGNFNNLLTEDGAYVGIEQTAVARSLVRWQQMTTNDLFSLTHDPLFANPIGGDFHLFSTTGRFNPLINNFVADAQSSLLIDAGDPTAAFSAEPMPNGGRVNIGLYGNDDKASKTPAGGWLVALTLNDGGTISGTNEIRWLAGGSATGHMVHVDFSRDGGVSWTNIATNVSANTGVVIWDTTPYGSTPIGVWRVVSQLIPSIYDETDNFFGVNNEPLTYYINDASTNGDVYCTEPGSSLNDGRSPATPLDSLRDILLRYDFMPGDRVLVDTGVYNEPGSVLIDQVLAGIATNPIVIRGSTNLAEGGSVLRFNQRDGIIVRNTEGILIQEFTVRDAARGVLLERARDCTVEGVDVRAGGSGFAADFSVSVLFRNCSAVGMLTNGLSNLGSTGTVWQSGLLWSNNIGVQQARSELVPQAGAGDLTVVDSVIGSLGAGQVGFVFAVGALTSDYNAVFVTNGALVGEVSASVFPRQYETLSSWSLDQGQDLHSVSRWPRFADAENGNYRLLSQGGRYNPSSGGFVLDSSTSPLLDAGKPTSTFTNESLPNGQRINIGRYGNTYQASRTPTNSSLTVLTANDGGSLQGSVSLYWVARGSTTGHAVRIRYSWDGGVNWTNVATGLAASDGVHVWNTVGFTSTVLGVWEIISETEPTISDRTDRPFGVRNTPIRFYVNDSSTNGDVYCSAVGASGNSGLLPSAPKAGIQQILDAYDIEPGDVIYVDTGTFNISSNIVVTQFDAARTASGPRVVIQGSTNYVAGGTSINRQGGDAAIVIMEAAQVELRNLNLRNAYSGVRLRLTRGCLLEWVFVDGCVRGFDLDYNEDAELRRCVARNSSVAGLFHAASSNTVWQNGVLWSNSSAVVMIGSTNVGSSGRPNTLGFSNSVVSVYGTNAMAFRISSGVLRSGFNCVLVTNGARVAGGRAQSLSRWSYDTGNDAYSLSHDPGLADPSAGDFHPKSQAGRFTLAGGVATDTVTSVLVDSGNRLADFSSESEPNGRRVNIGLYGNTWQASRTPTNASLIAVSYNDGGLAVASNVLFYWIARGAATGHTVRIQYSGDGGAGWLTVATNLPATNAVYSWDASAQPTSLESLWRVVSEPSPSVWDQNDVFFSLRNGTVSFYVNNGSTNGAVYTTAIGAETNTGLTASSPKPSISSILSAWAVEPGDTLYVDTGIYTSAAPIALTAIHSGDTNAMIPFTIQGSTNHAVGGTVLQRLGSGSLIATTNSPQLVFRDLYLRPTDGALVLGSSDDVTLERVFSVGGSSAFSAFGSRRTRIRNCVARNATVGIRGVDVIGMNWEHGVLWSNETAVILSGGSLSVSNSIIGVYGTNSYAYSIPIGGLFAADYNCIFLTNGARAAFQAQSPFPRVYETVSRMARGLGLDEHSLTTDPLFADPLQGDFHLLSTAGRFNPTSETFVSDAISSPLIDAGAPSSPFVNEPSPNGSRVNIGLYGNTWQASKTPTNARLITVSMNDGGRGELVKVLNWVAVGAATAHTVRLEFSSDGGSTWSTIAAGLPATNGQYVWDTRTVDSTIRGVWRVISETDPFVQAQTERLFAIRNQGLSFYVNNSSTNGNVYTTAPGAAGNNGVLPASPKDTIQGIISAWDLEPGDTIYVDTGSYPPIADSIRLDYFSTWMPEWGTNRAPLVEGLATNRLLIQGSTNVSAGGTLLVKSGGGVGFFFEDAPGVALRDIAVQGAGTGVRVFRSHYAAMDRVQCIEGVNGVSVELSENVEIRHAIVRNTSNRGVTFSDSRSGVVRNAVIWSNRFYGVVQESPVLRTGELLIENSLIGSFGSNSFAYFDVRGAWSSDYNCIYVQDGAFAGGRVSSGTFGGSTSRYENVYRWSAALGRDYFTLSPTGTLALANPAAGDFRLKTRAALGRFDPLINGWTNDTVNSILIDAGNPSSPYTNEPIPNGKAINIGAYGNTWQASKTPTNYGWFSILTLNDGGTIFGTVTLHWVAGGIATGHYVNVDFSPVAGLFWTNIVTSNSPAARGSIEWDTTKFGRSFAGLWRVVSCTDTGIYDISDEYLTLATNVGGTVWYFVNDASTNGDVYCTEPGHLTNSGYSPDAPALSIKTVIDSRKLEPGDRIYVDTGTYNLTADILITDLDSGNVTNPVRIIGSYNKAAGGSVLNRQVPGAGTAVFRFDTASGIELRDMTLRNAAVGLNVSDSSDCWFVGLRSENHATAAYSLLRASRLEFRGCLGYASPVGVSTRESGSMLFENCVFWDNPTTVSFQQSGSHQFRNSVLHASGYGQRVYNMDQATTPGVITADYNNYVFENGALVAEKVQSIGGNDIYATLTDWQRALGKDFNTLSHDPLFTNSLAGDFHEMPNSPLIDTGDPSSAYSNEPDPNGARINMGLYGNTAEAGLSRTNPWLLTVSVNDGGSISGTQALRWVSGSMTNNTNLRLEYSRNGGIEWFLIASNIVHDSSPYQWDVSMLPPGNRYLWRIVNESDETVSDMVDRQFSVKNAALRIYVNDIHTNGDVYCTSPGSAANTGLTPGSPILDPVTAVTNYPIGAGDIIYIDTGVYSINNVMLFDIERRGESNSVILLKGSTNYLAGGSVITRGGSGTLLRLDNTRYVVVENLKLGRGSTAVDARNTVDATFRWVEVYSNATDGFLIQNVAPFVMEHCVSWRNSGWGVLLAGGSGVWDSGVISSNSVGAVKVTSGGMTIQNSILDVPTTNALIYEIGPGSIGGDYNIFRKLPGGAIGRDIQSGQQFPTLHSWQTGASADHRSLMADPLFADARGGDFHLRSKAGRWSPAGTNWVQDTNTSWAIDAGNPSAVYTNEPLPNGGRLNAGLYGNTEEASLSVTNTTERMLLVAALADGGIVGGEKRLVWLSRGMEPSDLVRLEYSTDGGQTWSVIASNVNVLSSEYNWDMSAIPSSPLSYWRVSYQDNPMVTATNPVHFTIRNSPISYYVNVSNSIGDVYCTSPGNATNLGYRPDQPKARIQDIVNTFDLDPGDIVYVDTGFYPWSDTIQLNVSHSGSSTAKVTIIGSTNRTAGGTTLRGASANRVFNLRGVSHVTLSHFIITNADTAVHFELASAQNILSNLVVCNSFGAGISFLNSGPNEVKNTVITRSSDVGIRSVASAGNTLESCVIWSNSNHAISLLNSGIGVSNSVLYASGSGRMCYFIQTNSQVVANYNVLFTTNLAAIGNVVGVPMVGLPQWNMATTQDLHSINADPLFADPLRFDYHPLSQEGRYVPVLGSYVYTDTVTSLLIDYGAPSSPYTNETDPNGARRNIGLYGDTTEASKSRTNVWVKAITAAAGGRLQDIFYLTWNAVNVHPTNTVRLDYSPDNGGTWTAIVANAGLSVTNYRYLWNSAQKNLDESEVWPSSPLARWRVTVEADTNIFNITDTFFLLRNRPFTYFLNDSSTNGDVYCTAVGNDTNLGIFPHIPKTTLKNGLQNWDLVGEDAIYVDTGVYLITTNDMAVWGAEDAGTEGMPVLMIGNTNALVSLFDRASVGGSVTILSINGQYVTLRNMAFVGGNISAVGGNVVLRDMLFTNSTVSLSGPSQLFEDVQVFGGSVSAIGGSDSVLRRLTVGGGQITLSGTNIFLENSLIYGGSGNAVSMSGGEITLRNNTLAGGGTQFRQTGSGTAVLENNILVADGSGRYCIDKVSGVLVSDYNNLVARNGAWIGNVGIESWERLLYWQRESGQDLNSISVDPLFADEAGRDYHLKSTTGRWTPTGWTNDTVHSPCIDMGRPSSAYTNEPAPNGFRVNMGAFGNTVQASKSRTNAWLQAMSMNDGGVMKGTNTLRWRTGNLGAGDLVRIEYSWNNGSTWTTVVSSLSATAGQYIWDTTQVPSSLQALWRIVLQTNVSVQSQSATNFAVRNTPLKFYVNDSSTVGDVYTRATGHPLSDGLTTNSPKNSVQGILDAYDVEGGDVIYVDTGTYTLTAPVRFIWSRGGDDDSGNLIVQGSTNYAFGGSVFNRNNLNANAFEVPASRITIRDVVVQNAFRGIFLENSRNSVVERVLALSNNYGVVLSGAIGATNRNLRLWNNLIGGVLVSGAKTTVTENCTFVGNKGYGYSAAGSTESNVLHNSIFYVVENNAVALAGDSNVLRSSFIDYNIYHFVEPSPSSTIYDVYEDLMEWQLIEGHDFRSAITNPLFADVNGGDFHLQSTVGRFVDGSGWTTDGQDSWGIDRGNPGSDYSLEPEVRGNRINLGAYGGTEFASKGSTNAFVYARVLNEPLFIGETNSLWPLIWTVQNVPLGETFSVQYSGDGGLTWYNLASGLSAYQEYIIWQTTPFFNTWNGYWRVVGESNTNYWDANDSRFQIFYGEFEITQVSEVTKLPRIRWRGAWNEHYQVQYSTNILQTSPPAWINAVTGVPPFQIPYFLSTNGGDFIFEDAGATNRRFRMYRVQWLTNGP